MKYALLSKGRSLEKKIAVLLDFVQMRGGGLPNFFVTFSRRAFLVKKGIYSFQNTNYLNFESQGELICGILGLFYMQLKIQWLWEG